MPAAARRDAPRRGRPCSRSATTPAAAAVGALAEPVVPDDARAEVREREHRGDRALATASRSSTVDDRARERLVVADRRERAPRVGPPSLCAEQLADDERQRPRRRSARRKRHETWPRGSAASVPATSSARGARPAEVGERRASPSPTSARRVTNPASASAREQVRRRRRRRRSRARPASARQRCAARRRRACRSPVTCRAPRRARWSSSARRAPTSPRARRSRSGRARRAGRASTRPAAPVSRRRRAPRRRHDGHAVEPVGHRERRRRRRSTSSSRSISRPQLVVLAVPLLGVRLDRVDAVLEACRRSADRARRSPSRRRARARGTPRRATRGGSGS